MSTKTIEPDMSAQPLCLKTFQICTTMWVPALVHVEATWQLIPQGGNTLPRIYKSETTACHV